MTKQSSRTSPDERLCLCKITINKQLLPIKIHYFLVYAAIGCALPYMPVVGKELGINATAVGFIYTVVPFVVLFSKPCFGMLADHFQNSRLIMYVLLIVTTVSFFLVTLIPRINNPEYVEDDVTFLCLQNSIIIHTPSDYNTTCVRKMISNGTQCDLEFIDRLENASHIDLFERMNSSLLVKFRRGSSEFPFRQGDELVILKMEGDPENNHDSYFVEAQPSTNMEYTENLSFRELCNNTGDVYEVNCRSNLRHCSFEKGSDEYHWEKLYDSYQFWLYAILCIISGTGAATLFCLSDAACMEILDEDTQLFGKQRLWGTVSWGLCTLFSGYLNDLASSTYSVTTYAPGFYLMVGLTFFDLFALYYVAPKKSAFSSSICKDVSRIFASCEIVCFGVAVTVIGALSGLLVSYQLWYLQDLGANQLLLGITVAVQCILAEVPFFFVSGYILNMFGHFNCLIATFGAFSLRYCLYFLLKDPWLTLPIEILHGQTFGVFLVSMMSYAKTRAPAGTESTMIGVMGGLFEGLGYAIGNILSGIGFDYLTGRYTFLTAGIVSAAFTVIFFVIRISLKISS